MQASHSQEAARGRMDAQVLTLPGNLSRNLSGGETSVPSLPPGA
jgi:hypothetical protein